MIGKNDYYHSRGVTIRRVVAICRELGLNPCVWSHLRTAYGIAQAKYALR